MNFTREERKVVIEAFKEKYPKAEEIHIDTYNGEIRYIEGDCENSFPIAEVDLSTGDEYADDLIKIIEKDFMGKTITKDVIVDMKQVLLKDSSNIFIRFEDRLIQID